MLLALTRPSRSADLANLYVTGRRYTPEGVVFYPRTLAKQSRQGKPVTEFFFPSFMDDIHLCPVTTLRVYEERTGQLEQESHGYSYHLYSHTGQLLPVPLQGG